MVIPRIIACMRMAGIATPQCEKAQRKESRTVLCFLCAVAFQRTTITDPTAGGPDLPAHP
jgi:hypothetical protein